MRQGQANTATAIELWGSQDVHDPLKWMTNIYNVLILGDPTKIHMQTCGKTMLPCKVEANDSYSQPFLVSMAEVASCSWNQWDPMGVPVMATSKCPIAWIIPHNQIVHQVPVPGICSKPLCA